MVTIYIGRWIITLLDWDDRWRWYWNVSGYDYITRDWGFGWWAQVMRMDESTDDYTDPDAGPVSVYWWWD